MPARDALTVLEADHRNVDRLFSEFQQLGDAVEDARQALARKIVEELLTHTRIEEQVFYPRVRELGGESRDEVLEAVEEHHLIKALVIELNQLTPKDERFDAKMQVLQEQVEHHVHEEETEMFPRVRRAFDPATLERLGEELESARHTSLR